jgi:outer membrane biosynthesis protein TonB
MLETKLYELAIAVTQLTTAIDALRAQMPSTTTTVTSGTAATTTTVEAPKPKKAKAPKAEEPAPAPEPTPEPTPEPAPAPAPVAEVSLKDIRDAAQAALDAGKLNDVVALNKRFGLKRISDAPLDQYSAIHAALKEITDGQA